MPTSRSASGAGQRLAAAEHLQAKLRPSQPASSSIRQLAGVACKKVIPGVGQPPGQLRVRQRATSRLGQLDP